jgi:hypothetical protein
MLARMLDISTVNAQLDISSTNPRINIRTSGNSYVEIDRQKGKLDISTQPVKLQLDNTDFFAAQGIKQVSSVISENAQAGRQSMLDTIGNYAQQGDMLMEIPNSGNILSQIAEQKADSEPQGIDIQPNSPPVITWQSNSIKFNFTPDIIKINPDNMQKVDTSLERGNVDIKVKQAAQVYIRYIGESQNVPKPMGMDTSA